MKNIVLLVACCFTACLAQAQVNGKNMAKVNLTSFIVKGFHVQYEREILPRLTAAIGYGAVPKSTIAFKSILDNQVGEADINVGDIRLGTSVFTPEVRYYFGRPGTFHGFYLAGYARIGKYLIEGPVSFFSSTDKRTVVFGGNLNTVTGGLMIGSQWQLSKKLYLDWWILGGSFGGAGGNLVAATPLSSAEQQDLKRELDRIEVPFTTIRSEVNSNGAIITTSGNTAGIRGLGLNLGIRF